MGQKVLPPPRVFALADHGHRLNGCGFLHCAPAMGAGMTNDDYFSIDAEHFSSLKFLLDSPRAYARNKRAPTVETDAMLLGTATHTAVLEPELFSSKYAIWNQGARRGAAWKSFCDENANRRVLTVAQYDASMIISHAVRAHPIASSLLSSGAAEVSVSWIHGSGLPLKGRVDWLGDVLADLKITRDPTPRAFMADAFRRQYPMQLAMYSDGVAIAMHRILPAYVIAAQNVEPFEVVVYAVGADTLDHGRAEYELAITRLLECRSANAWPGIADDAAVPFELPRWANHLTTDASGVDF